MVLEKFKKIKRRKTLIFSILLILSLMAAAVSSIMPLKVRSLTLHPQVFAKGFSEEGTIVPVQEWPIFNPVDGKLVSLHVKNGDKVKKGQVLLEIDTSDLNYQLESLKAQLTSLEGQRLQSNSNPYEAQIAQQKLIIGQAEKDAQAQEENLAKMKALFDAGAISEVEYEEAGKNSEKAKNFLEQQQKGLELMYEQKAAPGTNMYYSGQKNALQAQISQIQAKIAKAKIIALQDGTVKDISLQEGTYIPLGQKLLTVFQDQGFQVESYVLASDALDLKPGSSVEIIQKTGAGKKSLTGKVETVDPSAVERISPLGLKEKRVKVTLSLQGTSSILLGSSVDVKFTTLEEPNKLMVPKTALFPYQQGYAVWVVKNGRAQVRPVQKGLENDHDMIIEQGVSDGDTILLDIDLKGLQEGKRVQAILD